MRPLVVAIVQPTASGVPRAACVRTCLLRKKLHKRLSQQRTPMQNIDEAGSECEALYSHREDRAGHSFLKQRIRPCQLLRHDWRRPVRKGRHLRAPLPPARYQVFQRSEAHQQLHHDRSYGRISITKALCTRYGLTHCVLANLDKPEAASANPTKRAARRILGTETTRIWQLSSCQAALNETLTVETTNFTPIVRSRFKASLEVAAG